MRAQGNYLTKFKSELRTGFEFGCVHLRSGCFICAHPRLRPRLPLRSLCLHSYASRVKANVKVKLQRDATDATAQGPAIAGLAFGDDGYAVRVIEIFDDENANLEDTSLRGATAAEADARAVLAPAFDPPQDSLSDYNIIKEFPGEIQVFIDDMDRYVFQVAVEDRDMARLLDGDGNAYLGFTASTGSRGFALPGYDAEEVHQTHDILAWNFCNNPGCVPCALRLRAFACSLLLRAVCACADAHARTCAARRLSGRCSGSARVEIKGQAQRRAFMPATAARRRARRKRTTRVCKLNSSDVSRLGCARAKELSLIRYGYACFAPYARLRSTVAAAAALGELGGGVGGASSAPPPISAESSAV